MNTSERAVEWIYKGYEGQEIIQSELRQMISKAWTSLLALYLSWTNGCNDVTFTILPLLPYIYQEEKNPIVHFQLQSAGRLAMLSIIKAVWIRPNVAIAWTSDTKCVKLQGEEKCRDIRHPILLPPPAITVSWQGPDFSLFTFQTTSIFCISFS